MVFCKIIDIISKNIYRLIDDLNEFLLEETDKLKKSCIEYEYMNFLIHTSDDCKKK